MLDAQSGMSYLRASTTDKEAGSSIIEPTSLDTRPFAAAHVTPLGGRQTPRLGLGKYGFGLQ